MISASKILNEINDYNLVKLNLDDNYNFEKSDNAYLIKKGSILSFGDNKTAYKKRYNQYVHPREHLNTPKSESHPHLSRQELLALSKQVF